MEEDKPAGAAAGWFKTHPGAADRLGRVKGETAALGAVPAKLDVRTVRFKAAVKGLV